MRRLLILLILLSCLPVFAKEPEFRNVFITDTTEAEEYLEPDNVTLKGYAQFMEDSDTIYLKDDDDQFVLNLKKPQKITSDTLIDKRGNILAKRSEKPLRYNSEEYQFFSDGYSSEVKAGGLSVGTSYDDDIDYAQFNRTAGIFTKYETKHFGIKTAYKRSFMSAYGNYIDNIYIIPEIKINNILSLREALSTNTTYRRNKAEFIISINPLARTKHNSNRLNIEVGTVHIYDDTNSLIKSQLKFNTRFKL